MNTLVDSVPAAPCRASRFYLATLAVFLLVADSLLVLFAYRRLPLDLSFFAAAFCLNIFLALFFLLGNKAIQAYLQEQVRDYPDFVWLFLSALMAAYLFYAWATQSLQLLPLLKLLAYLVLPAAVLLTVRNRSDRMCWQDLVVILALWLPLDFRWMRDVWAWPNHSLAYSMNSLLASSLAVFLFVIIRRLGGVGYHYHFRWKDSWIGLRHFLYFAPIAIPIGLAMGFIAVSNHLAPGWNLPLSAIGIFLFIAMPEELLFRGIIQNLLQKISQKPHAALVFTSVLFGAAHLNNGPRPDWRYFLLATIAGLFYGNAYTRSGALLAPAITHTLVDTVWRTFFR